MIFNDKIKNDFLNQFENNDTKEVYKSIFKKSSLMEEENNIDIFDFDATLLEKFIKEYIKPKTKQSARTYCNVLSSYIQWAIDNNHSKLMTNPLRRNQEYLYSFVNNQNNLYLSKDEIDAIVFTLVNAQDSFIVQALFDGIQGSKVSELTTLKKDQIDNAIDNNNKLMLFNIKSGKEVAREMEVDQKTIELALIAYREREYYKRNGEVDYSDNINEIIALPDSDYILKPTATRKGGDKPVSHYTVYNRLEMIKSLEEFEEYKDSLTTKNIVRSGMLYEAKKTMDKGRSLDRKAIEEICDKYGIKYKWSLKDFLNEDTVKAVYS